MIKSFMNALTRSKKLVIIGDSMELLDEWKHQLRHQDFDVITVLAVNRIEPEWTTNKYGKLNHGTVIRDWQKAQGEGVPRVGNTDYIVKTAEDVTRLIGHLNPAFLLTTKRLNRASPYRPLNGLPGPESEIARGEAVIAAANKALPDIPKAILDVKSREHVPAPNHNHINLAKSADRHAVKPTQAKTVYSLREVRGYFNECSMRR